MRIITLTQEADVKRLLLLFSQAYEPDSLAKLEDESYLATQEPRPRLPASLIAQLVLPHNARSLGVQSVIIESDYVDRDSNIAYARLYARAFRDYPRRTLRLHFSRKQLTSYDELSDEQALQESYVGFCVLSVTQPGNIGRTVLPPPRGDSSWFFVPAQSEFSVNLSGAQLRAEGTAFIQQNGRVAACASAAAWMSTIILARQFGFDMPVCSIADITQLATKYSLPPLWGGARPGLEVQQILWALHEMGYEPLSHEVWDSDTATELIYNYVESGIPPMLVIFLPERKGFHAVTVVGHTYDPSIDPVAQIEGGIHSVSAWCPFFLVHDDQIGPYLKLRISSPNPRSEGRPSLLVDETDSLLRRNREEIAEWYRDAALHYVIAPLPPRYMLRPEEAAAKGRAILTEAYSLHSSLLAGLGERVPAVPLYRTYFVTSNQFRRHFVPESVTINDDRKVRGLSSELAHWYRGSIYPRYVWVTELCALEHRTLKQPEDLRIVADVTVDPTSSPYLLDFVTLHLPHLFFRMPPTGTNVASALRSPVAFIRDDRPYQPFLRLGSAQAPLTLSP